MPTSSSFSLTICFISLQFELAKNRAFMHLLFSVQLLMQLLRFEHFFSAHVRQSPSELKFVWIKEQLYCKGNNYRTA